ncbi:ATP-binding protein [Bifidobacterium sp. ESL0790]|uniref:ATP-binding protein n=1 Tax=Bifidobacterium sp. ESL0790 TaxID=2983233 RepID=UPI0023F8FFBC|nr:ATP-binding protein [Bifidobacterium sp. ESL0790]WEV72412.1 ATP-binding protein [Bifidobacterium sp. ESL0790]
MINRPTYLEQIKPYIGKHIIKVLIGARRTGKSTLLKLLKEHLASQGASMENTLHLSFDSNELAAIQTGEDLAKYVSDNVDSSKPIRLFLDEIQEVDGWERALRSFLVDYDADIYITGSNAHVLSSDLATFITGRYVTIEVFPLSFKEFMPAYLNSNSGATSQQAFRAFAIQGGFPFQQELDFNQDASLHYLEDLFSTILLKDVVQRNSIRDVDALERIVRYAIAEEGHLLTTKNISDYFRSERRKVTAETTSNYLNAAEKAYMLYKVSREDAVGKKMLAFNEKYYVVDQGLRQALGMNNVANIDQVLEGIVCIELLRRGYKVTVGKVENAEVDFIARKGDKTEYYQVTYLAADAHTRDREFGALEKIHDSYPKTVLSLDEYPYSRNGIQGANLIDWLLK